MLFTILCHLPSPKLQREQGRKKKTCNATAIHTRKRVACRHGHRKIEIANVAETCTRIHGGKPMPAHAPLKLTRSNRREACELIFSSSWQRTRISPPQQSTELSHNSFTLKQWMLKRTRTEKKCLQHRGMNRQCTSYASSGSVHSQVCEFAGSSTRHYSRLWQKYAQTRQKTGRCQPNRMWLRE